jgi:futalosine hydrolase
MILLAAATDLEIHPVSRGMAPHVGAETVVLGVGPLEAAVSLTRMLASREKGKPEAVVLFGVGGAYPESGAGMLDLCLASQEIWADHGIVYDDRQEPFADPDLFAKTLFPLDAILLEQARTVLVRHGINPWCGPFVTVAAVSGTEKRGRELYRAHKGICENMEGAAVARVCREFAVPCLEMRCISNMVEDRDHSRWNLEGAVQKCADAVALLLDCLDTTQAGFEESCNR